MSGSVFDSADFEMPIEDVFSIAGRGTVVTGVVQSGSVRTGESLLVLKPDGSQLPTRCQGIEAFRRVIDEARPGDRVGLLLEGLSKDQVERGDVVRSVVAQQPAPGGTITAPAPLDPRLAAVPSETLGAVAALVAEDRKIEAIKLLRERYPGDLSLADAKDLVEAIAAGGPTAARALSSSLPATAPSDIADSALSALLAPYAVASLPASVETEMWSALQAGQKIVAIKLLRESTEGRLGLKEAKDVVEAWAGARGLPAARTGGCFIATATCGTEHAPMVALLRDFRDTALRPAPLGRALIRAYEALSPAPARLIARSPHLRALARALVVRPAALVARGVVRRR